MAPVVDGIQVEKLATASQASQAMHGSRTLSTLAILGAPLLTAIHSNGEFCRDKQKVSTGRLV
jgi:hypothetical protein